MEKLKYNIEIDAPRQRVWDVLWGQDTYPKWTRVFSEGSEAVTDWQEGSKVQFLNGKGEGMYSTIDRRQDHEFMSIRHLGEIKDGQEVPGEADWTNAMENYTLRDKNGKTELIIEMDGTAEFKDYFNETFPKALDAVKKLSEQG